MIHSKEPEVLEAREKIVKRYKRLKKKPLYYHFYYAFGTLTLMGYLAKRRKRCSNIPFAIIIEICVTRADQVVTETTMAEQVQICKTVEEYPQQFFFAKTKKILVRKRNNNGLILRNLTHL